jgi:hypothetical protein
MKLGINGEALTREGLPGHKRRAAGGDAVLVVDDTTIPKKGTHSVGVTAQYASALCKTANCQTLVSLTLAQGEVPVMLALRLFLPESWTSDRARLKRAGVPAEYQTARTKPELALVDLNRRSGKKGINGPPPQSTLPAVHHAILELIARPPPQRCPYCRKRICSEQRHE